MKKILVIEKNSFLAKAFNFINKENFILIEFKKIKFENYDKLILLACNKYFYKRKNFF